jgi:iron complex transport system ATP-binding protein
MQTLEARDLCCRYGHRTALDGVSLSARAGEVLAVLGPNGSGKTTLLRALARLHRPAEGSVRLQGQNVWSRSPGQIARDVALMPQSERRDAPLTVEQTVALGRMPHRGWLLPLTTADRAAIDMALRAAALEELRERPITELSGGEWRRVILARSLAQEARVLLLDEPTSGLDLRFQMEILQLVQRLTAEQQLTVVLTLHDLSLAALHADRIALLSPRGLLACGPPNDVLTAENIETTFGIRATVMPHPVYGTPLIVPLRGQM